jgi:hypothetical protein
MASDFGACRNTVRPLQELRIHPALEESGFHVFLPEFQEVARVQSLKMPKQPVLVTKSGLILSGFGLWRMAVLKRDTAMECLEYSLTDEAALEFMLILQKKQSHWNPFIRIHLALRMEETLQERALANMQAGGKYKGLATLPKAARINVRKQIAAIAGVGSRNVSKVKEIILKGHPRILGELASGGISINCGHKLCKRPFAKQLEALTEKYCGRVLDDVEADLIRNAERERFLESSALLDILQRHELDQPGSVAVRFSSRKRTIVLVGEDLRSALFARPIVAQP